MTSTIHEAKTNLSKLIQRALAGEEVIIANRHKPVVKLVAIEQEEAPQRSLGIGKHLGISIPEDFDGPLEDLNDAFYGDDLFPNKVAEDESHYPKEEH
ncbi:type II toxin-antitoxin system Phd/YefM family antitoxin [Rubritalea marina]|uniref:type II toxin-antitoxin system Phd/YefM family antitoxin n=1 Tax=Rubritalea marina TaxID=361055 RepID=UPI00036741E3|nr:type II toxin-antitoxin system Phd/YefM family antitoxin [Rubritalea marina]